MQWHRVTIMLRSDVRNEGVAIMAQSVRTPTGSAWTTPSDAVIPQVGGVMMALISSAFARWLPVMAIVVSTPSTAQSGVAALDKMLGCRSVTSDPERLRCYDDATARVASARNSGALVALDRGRLEADKRQRFGLASPRVQPASDPLSGVQQITLKISRVQPSSYGRYRIVLSNTSTWETAEPVSYAPEAGAEITIRRAGFGGFRANLGKGRSFLIKRLQ